MTTSSNLMVAPVTAVRLAKRYIDATNPLSIGRSGRLPPFLACSALACIATGLIFSNFQQLERQRSHVVHDVDVAFELTCAPPEPSYRNMEKLIPIDFSEGSKPAPEGIEDLKVKKDVPGDAKQNSDKIEKVTAEAVQRSVPEAPVAVSRSAIAGDIPTPSAQQPVLSTSNPFMGSAAQAAAPPSAEASAGSAAGDKGATGSGGAGFNFGKGDANALAGGDFGLQNGMSMKSAPVALGNIGPYKRELIARIKDTWKPDEPYQTVAVEITVDHDGKLVGKELVQSTGNKHLDDQLLTALDQTPFNALPDWFRGNQLKIKLVLRNT